MNPILVTPPAGPVVDLPVLKEHLRVVGNHDDARIEALEKACVAHLDGWRGVLGRCLLEQQWRVEYPSEGLWRLPFPDVTSVAAINGDNAPVPAVLSHDSIGSLVKLEEAATVTLTAALPEESLYAVETAIKIWVMARYDNAEGPALAAADAAFQALISPLRMVKL